MHIGTKVSVIMATYNPIWEKCLFTLESIVAQEGVDIELIITDDGSDNNLFSRFTSFFQDISFDNYKLIGNLENQGTVKNYYSALQVATGDYIKLISPGDALYNETVLSDWVTYLIDSGKKWSFANAVFYQNNNEHKQIVRVPTYPRIIDCYTSGNDKACRWNYIVLEDYALGAALLCDRLLMTKYLSEFIDVVKYTEDSIHVAMMYDGILPAYYDKNVIIYEYGTGVSTGADKWQERVRLDMRNAEIAISKKEYNDSFQNKIRLSLIRINSGGRIKKRILKHMQRGGLKKAFIYKTNPRLSSDDCSTCGKWWSNYS